MKLINDFEAQGYGLLTLRDSEKQKLNNAEPRPGAPIACVGAGTGLGECYLTADTKGKYTCYASEVRRRQGGWNHVLSVGPNANPNATLPSSRPSSRR